jgi:Zn-dependent protease with chaperone function
VRQALAQAVAHLPPSEVPFYRLEFRQSTIGPNAFALPGGTVVLTDELYARVDGDPAVLVGVLGHELGHLRHRHGMRMLVQAGVLSAAAGALYGDFSTLFSQIPVLLGQASYSRAFEHEADVDSVRLLRADGISPAVMASFFVKLRQPRPGETAASAPPMPRLPIALASHPADAERIRFFEEAARGQ